jgi:hypothetical protein
MGFLGKLFGGSKESAPSAEVPKMTAWALEQVKANAPSHEMAQSKVEALLYTLKALRGAPGAQVFGMAASQIEDAGKARLEAAVIESFVAWKKYYDEKKDYWALLQFDDVGKKFDLAPLKLTYRLPLQCDPLGTRDGLDPAWLARLDKLEEAKAGKRKLNLAAAHVVLADDPERAPRVEFRPADPEKLYRAVLKYEMEERAAFPRELAAVWSISDGLLLSDDPFFRPVAEWEEDYDERGLVIGCGGYVQGALIISNESADLLTAEVIDVDDDAEERARYPNIGALFDALLGP